MSISLSLLLFLAIVGIYLLVIEIFTVLFRITGLSHETANYQAVSLLTSSGFTTTESEAILATKHRRQIAKWAMLFGYMFSVVLATSIINVILTVTTGGRNSNIYSLIFVVLIPVFFIMIFRLKKVRNIIDNLIKKFVESVFMKNILVNPFYILEIYGKEAICELLVTHVPKEIEGKTIFESGVRTKYGINYISINRKNENRVIDPYKDIIKENDKVVIYCSPTILTKVFKSSIDIEKY